MIKSNEIKKAALSKLNWKTAILVSLIFVLANTALAYAAVYFNTLTQYTPIFNIAINVIYLVLFVPLSFGFISAMTKLYKSQRVAGTTIFNEAILNFTKTISIFVRILLKILLPSIIIIFIALGILFVTAQNIPITEDNLSGYILYILLLYLIVMIAIAICTIPYILSSYILADNKDMTAKEIVERSAELMKNKKWNFVKLIISFLGWFIILVTITAVSGMLGGKIVELIVNSIGLTLLMPYLITSIRVFFEECNE